jgi:hypothetical protein
MPSGLQRIDTIRRIRVSVQDAAQIAVFDQAGQMAFACARDFVTPFAQFGWNERKAERRGPPATA